VGIVLGSSPVSACTGDCDGDGAVLVDEVIRGVNIALGTEELANCFAHDRDFDGQVTVDEILAAVTAALEGCPAPQKTAFVIGTDFETGAFAAVDLASRTITLPVSASRQVNADAVARTFGDRVYVVNRFGLRGDSIQVFDPARGFARVSDCSTGTRTNPQEIAFANSAKAFVTLYESSAVLVVDPSVDASCSGFVRGTIDLSSYADADGIPEMSAMAVVDEKLYVVLQRLDRNDLFAPAANGLVVVIDMLTETVVDVMPLIGTNPFGPLVVVGDRLLVSTVGRFGQFDGGIEEIDRAGTAPNRVLVSEAELGGDITDFVIVAAHIGYAVVSDASFRNAVVEFSPTTGERRRTLLDDSGFIAQVRATEAGDLYIADRNFARPGLRVFGIRDGVERPSSPLDIGLPPFDIVFLR